MRKNKRKDMSLKPVDAALMALLRRALFDSADVENAVTPETDWQAVFLEASQQTVLPLALEAALTLPPELQPDSEMVARFRGLETYIITRNERLIGAQEDLLKAFAREKIPCAILKGTSAACCYPRPELRVLGDIDLLIKRENLDEAVNILTEMGYGQFECNEEFHLGFSGERAQVELHFEATYFPENEMGQFLRALMEGALSHLQTASQNGNQFPALTLDRQAVSLLMHIQRHLKATRIDLRHLCDIAVFIAKTSQEEWAQNVIPALRQGGLFRFAQVVAKTCVLYLGLPQHLAPWCLKIDDGVCYELLAEFLRGGNFGRKDPESQASGVLSADKEGQGASRSLLVTTLRNINLFARRNYPIAARMPLVLPLFWVYLPLRYLQNSRKNRGMTEIKRTLSAGRRRQRLMSQLGIFEDEPRGKGE